MSKDVSIAAARPPSQTAQGAARNRAVHYLRGEEPKILNDWVAQRLLDYNSPEELLAAFDSTAASKLPGFTNLFAVRNRYAEDEFIKAYQDHACSQYIVIGAGLDSFAYRQTTFKQGECSIFEVDHPSSQQWKRESLAKAGIECPTSVYYVPVDFEESEEEGEESILKKALLEHGFDPTKPAFFSMLGVSQYINLESLSRTLLDIATSTSAKVTIVMERVPPSSEGHLDEQEVALMEKILQTTKQMGEPWITILSEEQTNILFKDAGYKHIWHEYPENSERRYLIGRKDSHMPRLAALVMASTA